MAQYSCTSADNKISIGIDVHKKTYTFTVMNQAIIEQQKKKTAKTIPACPKNFFKHIQKKYPNQAVTCAYEAGPTGFYLRDYLEKKNISCLIVSPLSLRRAPNEIVKNDSRDSRHLADDLHKGELTSIRIPEGAYRELRHLVSARDLYSHQRKANKLRIESLLLYTHLHIHVKEPKTRWSRAHIESLRDINCSSAVRIKLDMLIDDLLYTREQLNKIHKKIRLFYKEHKQLQNYMSYLQSIPGIGFVVAISILGHIGDPQHLHNERELASFVGLVPKERSSGAKSHKGSTTHLGNRELRSMFIEAAWVAIRYDAELRQFYHRIKKRHHPSIAKRKAIVAVARKMTHRVYRVLKDQRCYCIR